MNVERAFPTTIFGLSARIIFKSLKIRQDIGITPTLAPRLTLPLEIKSMAANENHAIDG